MNGDDDSKCTMQTQLKCNANKKRRNEIYMVFKKKKKQQEEERNQCGGYRMLIAFDAQYTVGGDDRNI